MRILPLASSVALITDGVLIAGANRNRALAECASGVLILIRELVSGSMSLKHSSVNGRYVLNDDGTYVWHDGEKERSVSIATSAEMQEVINDGITA